MPSCRQGSAHPDSESRIDTIAPAARVDNAESSAPNSGSGESEQLCVSCGRFGGRVRPTPLRSVVCGPCWAEHGGEASADEIGPAPAAGVPVRDPRGQAEWLARLAADPLISHRYRPTRERLLALARELAFRANWDSFEVWPTWARLMEVSGWARSTMAGWMRELRLRGWLATVESGSTPQFRPMALRDEVEGNRAAVYALRVPITADEAAAAKVSGDKTWTPTGSFDLVKKSSRGTSSRARRIFHSLTAFRAAEREIEALRARAEASKVLDFGSRPPVGPGQMLAAAAQLAGQHTILSRMSRKAIRSACRPYWAAGWTNNDVLHALAYRPSNWSPLPAVAEYTITHPNGWVRARLSAWQTPRGTVLPGYSDSRVSRKLIRERHGHGAARILPKGARVLTPADLREWARKHRDEAAETIARNQRRDRAEALAAPRPRAAAASAGCRAAARHELREHLLKQAREVVRERSQLAEPARPLDLPEGATPYERARARAAAERRFRWQR